MKKITALFLAGFMLCLGVVIGFTLSPVKHGVYISMGNNNHDNSAVANGHYGRKKKDRCMKKKGSTNGLD